MTDMLYCKQTESPLTTQHQYTFNEYAQTVTSFVFRKYMYCYHCYEQSIEKGLSSRLSLNLVIGLKYILDIAHD